MTTRRASRPVPALRLTALALAALLLSGCANLSGSNESGMEPGFPGSDLEEGAVTDESTNGGQSISGDRSIITTGYLYLTVDEPIDAAAEATRIVEQAGGRVDGRQENAPETSGSTRNAGSAELILRIPAARLTATLDELKTLGEVEQLSLNATDVSREVLDIDARVTALRASIDRLLALQGQAATVEDLIALETAISDRQAQLESYEAQQRALADQVALSTLTLVLGSPDVAPPDEPDTFFSGLVAGWEALVAFGSALLVLAGVTLPWLITLALIALVVLLIVRAAIRRYAARHAQPVETPRDAA